VGESAYSFSLTTFSPSGKLVQIEYALNAVATGSTSLGVKGAHATRQGVGVASFLAHARHALRAVRLISTARMYRSQKWGRHCHGKEAPHLPD